MNVPNEVRTFRFSLIRTHPTISILKDIFVGAPSPRNTLATSMPISIYLRFFLWAVQLNFLTSYHRVT